MSTAHSHLIGAAKSGNLKGALQAIEAGAEVNAMDDAGAAAIHYAAAENNSDMVRLLLSKGADPNLQSDNMFVGFSPLIICCINDYVDLLHVLHQHGATLTGTATDSRSALHWAAGKGCTRACAALLDLGQNIEVRDDDGRTPLNWATGDKNLETLKFLIERGADLEAEDKDGRTALVHSAECGRLETVAALLQLGARIPPRMLEDSFLEAAFKEAAPDECVYIDKAVRMVRAEALSRGIEMAFSDDESDTRAPASSFGL